MSALLALIQAKKQDLAAQRKGSTEKLGEGTTTLRIMGGWEGADTQFWHDFGKHFVKNAEGKLAESYICTRKTFGEPCAICDAVNDARNQNLPEHIAKLVQDSSSGGRTLVNAINPNHPKEPHKVHIYELPGTVFEQILTQAAMYMADHKIELIGPNGRDIYITRTGKGMQTKYSVTPAPASTPIPDVGAVNNLADFVKQESAEQRTRTLAAFRTLIGASSVPTVGAGLPAGLLAGGAGAPALSGARATPALGGGVDPVAAAQAAQAHLLQQQQAQQAAAAAQQAQALQAQQAAASQAAALQQQQAQQALQAQQAQQVAAAQAAAQAVALQQQQAAALQAQQAAAQAAAAAALQPAPFEDIPDLDAIAAAETVPVVAPIATPDLTSLSGVDDVDLEALLGSLMPAK